MNLLECLKLDFLFKPYKMKLIGLHDWTLRPTLELIPTLRIAKEGPKINKQTENTIAGAFYLPSLLQC